MIDRAKLRDRHHAWLHRAPVLFLVATWAVFAAVLMLGGALP